MDFISASASCFAVSRRSVGSSSSKSLIGMLTSGAEGSGMDGDVNTRLPVELRQYRVWVQQRAKRPFNLLEVRKGCFGEFRPCAEAPADR